MTHTLAYAAGILVLIIGVALSVALHELGHMIPAKRFGVKVPEYFIGFGPRLWSTRRGGTEYGVKAIWLGGYVKLLGMIPPARPGRVDKPGSMIADARRESLAELGPDEQDRAFYRLSVPRKLLVMAGGILTNLVLGIVFLALALGVVGQPAYTSTVSAVADCVSTTASAATSTSGSSGTLTTDCSADGAVTSPAAAAGLEAGDRIVSWNGTATPTWSEVTTAIADGGTSPASVVVERDGTELTLTVTPIEVERPVYDDSGNAVTDSSGEAVTELRPYVGIGPALGTVRESAGTVVGAVATSVVQTIGAIVTIPVGLYHAVAAGLGLEQRDASGLVSLLGVGRMAGEVASVGTGTSSVTIPFSVRLFSMLGLLGSLNLALFAFNLIPLLPLDGGHVAGACWEGIRRWWARRRGLPDPGYVDTARMLPVGQAVFILLILMAGILIWVDVVAPV